MKIITLNKQELSILKEIIYQYEDNLIEEYHCAGNTFAGDDLKEYQESIEHQFKITKKIEYKLFKKLFRKLK